MKQKKKLKVGVIGVGVMGKEHVRVYSDLNSCELVGLYDYDVDRAKEISSLYNTKYFPAYEDLITKVDAVSICTPIHTHYQTTCQAIVKGVHCLVEKPLTNNGAGFCGVLL